MENYRIFQFLDSPSRFLYWKLDETASFLIPLLIGFVFGHFFIGIIVSFFSFKYYKKLTTKHHPGFLKHFLYWHLPQGSSKYLKMTPPSWVREYIG